MNNLIQKITKRKLKIEILSNCSGKNSLLTWGNTYQSRTTDQSTDLMNTFIFHFKESAVRIDSYDMISNSNDAFPTKWTLSVSNDNEEWIDIDNKVQYLCNDYYKYPYDNKYFCRKQERFHFSLTSPKQGYYQYVKYHMIENSFYGIDNWKDLLLINGFEINGDFLLAYKKIPTCKCKNTIRTSFFIIILFTWWNFCLILKNFTDEINKKFINVLYICWNTYWNKTLIKNVNWHQICQILRVHFYFISHVT